MQLIEGWHRVLIRAWSAWCMYVAIVIQFAQSCLPYVSETIPWWLSISVLAAGLGLRIVKQGARGVAASGDDDDDDTQGDDPRAPRWRRPS